MMFPNDVFKLIVSFVSKYLYYRLVCKKWSQFTYDVMYTLDDYYNTEKKLKKVVEKFNVTYLNINSKKFDITKYNNAFSLITLNYQGRHINYFPNMPNLKHLNCSGITCSKDLSPSQILTYLNISYTNIERISDFPELIVLICSKSMVKTIPLSKGLRHLVCDSTKISSIPDLEYLTYLNCSNNKIKSLPKFKYLTYLNCSATGLTSLPYLEYLTYLNCSKTKIKELPFLEFLVTLICCETKIEKITGGASLKTLDCDNSPMSSIPKLPSLSTLICKNTPLVATNIRDFISANCRVISW